MSPDWTSGSNDPKLKKTARSKLIRCLKAVGSADSCDTVELRQRGDHSTFRPCCWARELGLARCVETSNEHRGGASLTAGRSA